MGWRMFAVLLVGAALFGCALGGCAPGAAACGDVQSDAANCGACGHSCLGGACSAGVCQPLALASIEQSAVTETLTVDGDSVYWLSSADGAAKVAKVPKAGGAEVVLASGSWTPCLGHANLAVDGESAYWVSFRPAALMSAPIGGGAAAPTALAELDEHEGSGLEAAVAVDGSAVYYKESFAGVWALPKRGGKPIELAKIDGDSYGELALGGGRVYWSELDGAVVSSPAGGGGATRLFAQRPKPIGAAVSGGSLFWLEVGAPSAVMTAALDGTGAQPIATGLALEVDAPIAVDATGVYLVSGSKEQRRLARVPLAGGAAEEVPGDGWAQGMVADAGSIYFTSQSQLLRIAK